MKKLSYLEYTMGALFLFGLVFLGYALLKINSKNKIAKIMTSAPCTETQKLVVKDNYIRDIAAKGQEVVVKMGSTECNTFQKGDVVLFRISTELDPVLRIVRGIPGDHFKVTRDKKLKRWKININDELITFNNNPYGIGHLKAEPPLKKHELEYKGVVPEGMFIMLSQIPPGSQDSGTFGLVKLEAALGKVTR